MKNRTSKRERVWFAGLLFCASGIATPGQSLPPYPSSYSVATPRPISPAEGTTNPAAQAAQRQNPFLGSVPAPATGGVLELSLREAVERGLRYNLGVIESGQSSAESRATRLRALAALLPQISIEGRQGLDNISYKEIGLRLPPIPGVGSLPGTSGAFGYQDARVSVSQPVYNAELRSRYESAKRSEEAAALSIRDARDVVVFAAATAYMQVIASAARLDLARAQLATARELDQQTADRVKAEVSPEIDSLRAQVERQSTEQRLTNAANQFEKDKLTLGRVIGMSAEQQFVLTDALSPHPLTGQTEASAIAEALQARSDLSSAALRVSAAEAELRAGKAQRLPVLSFRADYGGAGLNIGDFPQVYSISGNISIPIYTGGRIQAEIQQAQAELIRRQAEYADLKGRVAYDVRIAWLDAAASQSSVDVAKRNKELAARALVQSQDRYTNGVTNYLEVTQAQETVTAANENYIQSLYSLNVSLISLARAMGGADRRLYEFTGGN